MKYRSQSLNIVRNRQISFAIVKYRSQSSNIIRNRQISFAIVKYDSQSSKSFLYILREVFFWFHCICPATWSNPYPTHSDIHHMHHCTLHHPTNSDVWSRSTSSERVRMDLFVLQGAHTQTEGIHPLPRTCAAPIQIVKMLCIVTCSWDFNSKFFFSSGEPTASETFCFLWKTIAHCFSFFLKKKYLKR